MHSLRTVVLVPSQRHVPNDKDDVFGRTTPVVHPYPTATPNPKHP